MKDLLESIKKYFNPEEKEIYLVEIIYKNGERVSMWCSECVARESNISGGIVSLTVYGEYSDKYPNARYGDKKAIYIGISDISSVWQIGSMKIKV